MKDVFWWKRAVIYELYVDKFAGDFKELTGKIDYLLFLGVNTLHILPHYPSPMVDGGYDVSDYLNVRKDLGTREDFRDFARRAHEAGIKIILDLVLNHTSIEHEWFKNAARSVSDPKRDFYLWSKTGKEFECAANPFQHLKPANWIYRPQSGEYYFATFYPEQADLNWSNGEVFKEFTGIMDFWVSLGADGFRLDAASHLIKQEGADSKHLPETHLVLKRLRAHIEKNYPKVVLLAEAGGDIRTIKDYFGTGDECHLVYNFPLACEIIYALVVGEDKGLEEISRLSKSIPENASWANFLRNHDELHLSHLAQEEREKFFQRIDPENSCRFGDGVAMRLADIFSKDPPKILEAFKMLFDSPGSVMVYYGDELHMKNAEEYAARDKRELVRGPFDWHEAGRQMKDTESFLQNISQFIKARQE